MNKTKEKSGSLDPLSGNQDGQLIESDSNDGSIAGSSTTDVNSKTVSGDEANKDTKGAKRRKKRIAKRRLTKSYITAPFTFTTFIKENHNGNLYGCSFNRFITNKDIFATVGSNRVTIYEATPDNYEKEVELNGKNGGRTTRRVAINILRCYADPDQDEIFYTVAWSKDAVKKNHLLAVGGLRAVIRIINVSSMNRETSLIGHGHAINELKFHPKEFNLLLSASKDHSLRLWNIKTKVCIAIFGGVDGHRDEVLSTDFDLGLRYIVSSGMDHSLKIWKIDNEEMKEAIAKSYSHDEIEKRPFETLKEHFAYYSTRDIHRNYVDSVKWFGDLILSKSCENAVICWKPGQVDDELKPNETKSTVFHTFDLPDCEIWYIRFDTDAMQRYLAAGNQNGKVYVWNVDCDDPKLIKPTILSHPKCVTPVRQVAFSNDSKILVSVCDDGTVFRWDAATGSSGQESFENEDSNKI